jgi:hypothetical protein
MLIPEIMTARLAFELLRRLHRRSDRRHMENVRKFDEMMKKTRTSDGYFKQLMAELAALLMQLQSAIARHDVAAEASLSERASVLLGMMDQRISATSRSEIEPRFSELRSLVTTALAREEEDRWQRRAFIKGRTTGPIVDRVHEPDGSTVVVQRSGSAEVCYPASAFDRQPKLDDVVTIDYTSDKALVRDPDREKARSRSGERVLERRAPLSDVAALLKDHQSTAAGPSLEIRHIQ